MGAGSWFVSASRVGTYDLTEEERLFLVVGARFEVASSAGVSVSEEVFGDVGTGDLAVEERFFLVVLVPFEVVPDAEVSVLEGVSEDVGAMVEAISGELIEG